MKRLFCLFWMVLYIFTCSLPALAELELVKINEDFYIRNGIMFGMNADEIHQIEEANGNASGAALNSGEDGWASSYPNCDAGYQTSLAGEVCDIIYYLDDAGILSGFKYILRSDKAFTSAIDSLTEKYGKPGTIEDAPSFKTETFIVADWMAVANVRITTYDSWLVEYKDCCVFIEATTMKQYTDHTFYRIDYTVLSKDEAAIILELKDFTDQQAEQSLEDSL